MEIINASITRMEEVEIFGIPALYTSYRVSRQTVHLGLYCYELWTDLADGRPSRLMDKAEVGFCGTVLTPVPVEGTAGQGRAIGPEDFQTGLREGHYTPAEFEEKYLSPDMDPVRLEQIYGKAD